MIQFVNFLENVIKSKFINSFNSFKIFLPNLFFIKQKEKNYLWYKARLLIVLK